MTSINCAPRLASAPERPAPPCWRRAPATRAANGRVRAAWLVLASLGMVLPAAGEAQAVYGAARADSDDVLFGASERADPGPPFGLETIWRRDEFRPGRVVPSRSRGSFALDGRYYAVRNDSGARLLDARDGSTLGHWPAPAPQDAYSLAVSSTGQIAVGRVGAIEVSSSTEDGARRSARFRCADACGPVLDVAFSPDGRLLAYQGARGRRDRQRGLGYAVVLEARTGRTVARLEAVAARALVAFSPDGETLIASNATSFDETETFGLKTWRTSDWQLTRDLAGTKRRWRSIGRLGNREFVAAYEDDGRLELVDLATDRPLWSAPLVSAGLDAEETGAMRLALVALAPNGAFVLSYETSRLADPLGNAPGTLVIRDGRNGEVVALYDVTGVTDVAISPDSRSFVYSARGDGSYTVLARAPL